MSGAHACRDMYEYVVRESWNSSVWQLVSTETGFEGAEEGMAMKRAMEVKKMSIFCEWPP